jgi:N-acetylneuraminate synthase
VCADEIKVFCIQNPNIKICLDVSHSMMACNYYGWDLLNFVEKIAPYNVHMHIVDAKGSDGEGVEIGEGDVDFYALFRLLNKVNKKVQFIPEVWQGHKNNGEGFWSGLEFLERYSN